MINAPWHVWNQTVHDDLGIPFVANTIQKKEYKTSQQTRNALQPSRATTAATARLSKIKKPLVNRVQARRKRSFHQKKLKCYDPNYSGLISLYQLKRLAYIYKEETKIVQFKEAINHNYYTFDQNITRLLEVSARYRLSTLNDKCSLVEDCFLREQSLDSTVLADLLP